MNEKLQLFEFFHKLKNFTTVSYSAKKLQDELEKQLDKPIIEGNVDDYIKLWKGLEKDIQKSLEEISKL